jgi:hypothetical protein
MARRSSPARETRRSASGTHFLNGRAEKRAGKAGSITGASSGSPRSPPVSSCVFCPSSCTPYLYPRNPPPRCSYNTYTILYVQYTKNARTHARADTLTPYHTVLHSHSPLSLSLPSRSALCFSFLSFPFLFFPPVVLSFTPLYNALSLPFIMSVVLSFHLPALAFVISSFDLCSVCLTLFHLTILSRHLLAPTG